MQPLTLPVIDKLHILFWYLILVRPGTQERTFGESMKPVMFTDFTLVLSTN